MHTLRVFSNWLVMRVIMPSAAMKLSRDSTCAHACAHAASLSESAGSMHAWVCMRR